MANRYESFIQNVDSDLLQMHRQYIIDFAANIPFCQERFQTITIRYAHCVLIENMPVAILNRQYLHTVRLCREMIVMVTGIRLALF